MTISKPSSSKLILTCLKAKSTRLTMKRKKSSSQRTKSKGKTEVFESSMKKDFSTRKSNSKRRTETLDLFSKTMNSDSCSSDNGVCMKASTTRATSVPSSAFGLRKVKPCSRCSLLELGCLRKKLSSSTHISQAL